MVQLAEVGALRINLSLNAVDFSKSMQEINRKLKGLQTEFKASSAGNKEFENSLEGLRAKSNFLNDSLTLQSARVDKLKREYEQSTVVKGKDAKETELLLIRYNKAVASMKETENQLKQTTDQIDKQSSKWNRLQDSLNSTGQKMQDVGGNLQNTGQGIATSFGVATAAIGAGLGLAISKAMDFESQMSSVKSVMAPAEVKEFSGSLEELATVMGAKTKYSATEAAQGIEELIKAGVRVEDILSGGLEGALSLATAGELDLAAAAEIASTALNAFKDDNLTVSQAADVLAGAANASATSVDEMRYGLSMVSAVASSVGMTFKDTSTALAVFAQNGLKGSDGGTSLKTMLMNLQPATDAQYDAFMDLGLMTYDVQKGMDVLRKNGVTPLGNDFDTVDSQLRALAAEIEGVKPGTAKAEKAFRELSGETGVIQSAFFDASGSIKDLNEISGLLQESMKGMTDAQRLATMETMFGSDAIRAANILFKEGADGVNYMASQMDKIKAADVAAEKMNNLKGNIEELKGSFETGLISLGNALLPLMDKMVAGFQGLVNWFNNLSPGMQKFIAIGAVVVTAFLGLVTAIGVILAVVGGAIAGFGALVGILPTLGAALTVITGPIGLIIAAIVALIAAGVAIWKNWDAIKGNSIEIWGALKEWFSSTLESIKQFFTATWDKIKSLSSQTWESIKQTATNIWNSIVKKVTAIITPFVNGAMNIFNEMKDGLGKIFDGYKQYFEGVWNLIKNIFLGAVLLIVDLVTGDFEGLKEDSKAIFENIKKALSDIWEGIKKIFSGAVEAIKGFVGGAWENIKSNAINVFNAVKKSISDIWEGIKTFFTTTLENIKTSVSDGLENMKKAIEEKMSAAKNKIEEIWEKAKKFLISIDLKQIGKDIIHGLIDGVTAMIDKVTEKVKSVGEGIKNTLRKVLDIHSPSKATFQIGEYAVDGLALGIEQNSQKVVNAVKKVAIGTKQAFESAFDFEKHLVDERKFYNKLSLTKELEMLELYAKRYREGTEEREYYEREIYRVKKEINDQLTSINEQYANKISETNQRLFDEEKRLTGEYTKAVEDRTKSLYSFTGIFDEVTKKSDISGSKLIENLKSQVDTFSEWSTNIKALAAKGIDEGLISELKAMGPSAAAEIAALNSLADSELQQYANLWKEKNALARSEAEKELEGLKLDTTKKISELRIQTQNDLEIYKNEWLVKIQEIRTGISDKLDMRDTLTLIGKNSIQGLLDGMSSMIGPIVDEANKIAEAISKTIQESLSIHLPFSGLNDEIGRRLPPRLGNGQITNQSSNTSNVYVQPGAVTIPVSDLSELNSVVDFFDRLSQTAKAGVIK
ncbi:MAG: p15 [Bacillales bacterium]|nr:p15 [Bacillales bacterium]